MVVSLVELSLMVSAGIGDGIGSNGGNIIEEVIAEIEQLRAANAELIKKVLHLDKGHRLAAAWATASDAASAELVKRLAEARRVAQLANSLRCPIPDFAHALIEIAGEIDHAINSWPSSDKES